MLLQSASGNLEHESDKESSTDNSESGRGECSYLFSLKLLMCPIYNHPVLFELNSTCLSLSQNVFFSRRLIFAWSPIYSIPYSQDIPVVYTRLVFFQCYIYQIETFLPTNDSRQISFFSKQEPSSWLPRRGGHWRGGQGGSWLCSSSPRGKLWQRWRRLLEETRLSAGQAYHQVKALDSNIY